MSRDPTILYLAGFGRSGSTLLERTLGEMPGFVNVGELIDLFRRVAPRGERCGCGQPFAACPFWVRVGGEAFGGWDTERLAATHLLQRQVARQRHLPRLFAAGVAGRGFRAAVTAYGAEYSRLYRAIAAVAGARCIVDASKWPVQARSEEHTSELQSQFQLVGRLLLEKKKQSHTPCNPQINAENKNQANKGREGH